MLFLFSGICSISLSEEVNSVGIFYTQHHCPPLLPLPPPSLLKIKCSDSNWETRSSTPILEHTHTPKHT